MTSDGSNAPGDGGAAAHTGSLPFDTSVANQARIYDFLLGGKDNYAVDRLAAAEMLKAYPETELTARANRAFLGRAVRYLTQDEGVRQFLDIGTGIPTAGNTHQIAQRIAPESRVAYVDYDPVVLAHARALLTSTGEGATEYIDADLRDTGKILAQARQLLDFDRPVAITLLTIMHAITDADEPLAIVARLLEAVPPGSFLVITHAAIDLVDPVTMQGLQDGWKGKVQQQFQWRAQDEVARFFTGLELVEPGLVQVDAWRPDSGSGDAPKAAMWAGVGRKS